MARYVIRVNFPNGDVAWLRHGPVVGTGPIVRFPNKLTADANLDLIRGGLDEGAIASVVRIAPSVPNKRWESAESSDARPTRRKKVKRSGSAPHSLPKETP